MRYAWFAGLLGALLLVLPGLASAEPRVALIIANGNYKGDIGSLKNPVSDGKLMSDALKKVGFKVNLLIDGERHVEDLNAMPHFSGVPVDIARVTA